MIRKVKVFSANTLTYENPHQEVERQVNEYIAYVIDHDAEVYDIQYQESAFRELSVSAMVIFGEPRVKEDSETKPA
ncbi:hypothetical protein [Enterococcus sp. HY326]|uniref:hypothetical protein n=1 Tax=Enterococcus sp. HY326 TaxID=2971265 RepID=UPI00223EED84|nr:hypothetical protein [Enterococcus sp. HY326]